MILQLFSQPRSIYNIMKHNHPSNEHLFHLVGTGANKSPSPSGFSTGSNSSLTSLSEALTEGLESSLNTSSDSTTENISLKLASIKSFKIGISIDCDESWGYTVPRIYRVIKALYPNAEIIALYHSFLTDYQTLTSTAAKPLSSVALDILRAYNIDWLIIPGNEYDINPKLYNQTQEKNTKINPNTDSRNEFELALVKAATETLNIPVLGVCGGMHTLYVAKGGSLIQHIENHNAYDCGIDYFQQTLTVRKQSGSSYFSELLTLFKQTLYKHTDFTRQSFKTEAELEKAIIENESVLIPHLTTDVEFKTNPEKTEIIEFQLDANCAHHQACAPSKELNQFFLVTAKDNKDDCLELIENKYGALMLGVQFHPEIVLSNYLDDGFMQLKVPPHQLLFTLFTKAMETRQNKRRTLAELHDKIGPQLFQPIYCAPTADLEGANEQKLSVIINT